MDEDEQEASMKKVSRQFLIKLKLAEEPQYRIAQQAGVRPNLLSKLIHGHDAITDKQEARLLRVGECLGLDPEDVFEE